MLKLSFGVVLALRVAVCVTTIALYEIGLPVFAVGLMVVLAFASLRSLSAANEVKLLFSLVVSLKALWLLVVLASYVLSLPTVKLTDIRASVFSDSNTEIVVLLAAQMVYVLTLLTYRVPGNASLLRKNHETFYWVFLGIIVLASFLINRFSFIGDSVYVGNQNEYWGGLPAIFVIFLSAWMLLNREYGVRFILIFGVIIVYWLATGNRSEILVASMTGLAFFLFSSLRLESAHSRFVAFAGSMVAAFVAFSAIGLIRSVSTDAFSQDLLSSLLAGAVREDRLHISTVGASIYSALSAIDIAGSYGYNYGYHFVSQFVNVVPSFVPTPWDRYEDPFERYHSSYDIIGGFGILGESYMSFGWFGPMLVSVIFVLLLRALAKQAAHSFLAAWCLLAFCFYSQRLFYYGYVYAHNLLMFFLVATVVLGAVRLASGNRKNREIA